MHSRRLVELDRLRGLAIILMVIDHLYVASGNTNHWLRLTVTRGSLPLFCLIAGSLINHKMSGKRFLIIMGSGILAGIIGKPIGIGQPDILILLALCIGFISYCRPEVVTHVLIIVAILQPVTWPMQWTGYQPGTVFALVALGGIIGKQPLVEIGEKLPNFLATIGCRPLVWYIGHLLVLRIIF